MPGFKQFFGSFLPHKKQVASYKTAARKGILGAAFMGVSYCLSYLRKTFGDGEENGYEVSFTAATGQSILIDCLQEAGNATLNLWNQRKKNTQKIINKVKKAKSNRRYTKAVYVAKTSFDILASIYLLFSIVDPIRQQLQSDDYSSHWQKDLALEIDKIVNQFQEMGTASFKTLLSNNMALLFGLAGLLNYSKDLYNAFRKNRVYKDDRPIVGLINSINYIITTNHSVKKHSNLFKTTRFLALQEREKYELHKSKYEEIVLLYNSGHASYDDYIQSGVTMQTTAEQYKDFAFISHTHANWLFIARLINISGNYKLYNNVLQFAANLLERSGWNPEQEISTMTVSTTKAKQPIITNPRASNTYPKLRLTAPVHPENISGNTQTVTSPSVIPQAQTLEQRYKDQDPGLAQSSTLHFRYRSPLTNGSNTVETNSQERSHNNDTQKPDVKGKNEMSEINKTNKKDNPPTVESNNPADDKTKMEIALKQKEETEKLVRKNEILDRYKELPGEYQNLFQTIVKCDSSEVNETISEDDIIRLADRLQLINYKTASGHLVLVFKQSGASFHRRGKGGKVDGKCIRALSKALFDIGIKSIKDLNEPDVAPTSCCENDGLGMLIYALIDRHEIGSSTSGTSTKLKPN